ncbi:hypothetical protein ASD48_38590 [Streptomyces sp. Root1310]|nr:hypothetical protein ASD48_38590 [Streptomyces sp. Root1310]
MRASAGLTYITMAAHPNSPSPATLKRTAGGLSVPTWQQISAYCSLCANVIDAREAARMLQQVSYLWKRARMEQRGTLALRGRPPALIVDRAHLSLALFVLYEREGAPPLRTIQRRGGGAVRLPLSTAARIVNRQALPADKNQLIAFLEGCRVPAQQQGQWEKAWSKVMRS